MTSVYHIEDNRAASYIIKTGFLLATALSVHLSLSPPNPSVKSEDCCSGTEGTETLFERVVQSVTYCSKCMVWAGVVCNIIFLVIQYAASSSLRWKLSEWLGLIDQDSLSSGRGTHSVMIYGAFLTMLAAILRIWCFRSMGALFSFEIAILPKHQLITDGPYAWVRHPSYTGVYLTLTGATLVLVAPGSWTGDYGIWTPLGSILAMFWIFKCAFAFRGMVIRLRAEDEVLRLTFGAKWEEYAARVPFKFIPGAV